MSNLLKSKFIGALQILRTHLATAVTDEIEAAQADATEALSDAAAAQSTADAALPSASFTNTAVTGKLITGYVSGAGTVSAADSILQAIQKLNGNIEATVGITPEFQDSVLSILSTAPSSPASGDRHLVGPTPSSIKLVSLAGDETLQPGATLTLTIDSVPFVAGPYGGETFITDFLADAVGQAITGGKAVSYTSQGNHSGLVLLTGNFVVSVVTDEGGHTPSVTDANPFAGHANEIATWTGSAWSFVTPVTGFFVSDDSNASGLYYFGGSSWVLKEFETQVNTDDLSEGSTNLYFTSDRAKAAAVADAIADGVTDVAPSQNAVFDALALKADTASIAVANKETFTLDATDITNGYKDLAFLAKANSVIAKVRGEASIGDEGFEYSLSTVGGVTRLTFTNDWAVGGASALIITDVLVVQYTH